MLVARICSVWGKLTGSSMRPHEVCNLQQVAAAPRTGYTGLLPSVSNAVNSVPRKLLRSLPQ